MNYQKPPQHNLTDEALEHNGANDYTLRPDAHSVWIGVDSIAVYIRRLADQVVVELLPNGDEMAEPYDSCSASLEDEDYDPEWVYSFHPFKPGDMAYLLKDMTKTPVGHEDETVELEQGDLFEVVDVLHGGDTLRVKCLLDPFGMARWREFDLPRTEMNYQPE